MGLFGLVKFITTNFDKYLYLVLFILLFIEEAGVPLPVPGDIYIFLSGYQVVVHHASPVFILIDVTLASILGSSLLFFIILKKGEPLVEKYGKYIHISKERLEQGKYWFDKHGEIVILVGRWIPGLRIVLTIVGGIFRLEYFKFILAMGISSLMWSGFFLYLGITFGRHQDKILNVFKYVNTYTGYIFYLVILLLVTALCYLYLRAHRRRQANPR